MKLFITHVFGLLFCLTLFITVIVGLSWLFNYYPTNLYYIWELSYKSLTVAFLFFILFGEKINN